MRLAGCEEDRLAWLHLYIVEYERAEDTDISGELVVQTQYKVFHTRFLLTRPAGIVSTD